MHHADSLHIQRLLSSSFGKNHVDISSFKMGKIYRGFFFLKVDHQVLSKYTIAQHDISVVQPHTKVLTKEMYAICLLQSVKSKLVFSYRLVDSVSKDIK